MVLVNEQGPPPLANAVLEDGLEDYEILSRYGKCYLARNRSHTPAEGDERFNYKQILYLEGSAYDRGFAEGYLCAEAVERMVFEFVYNFVRDFLGASPKQLPDYLIEPVRRVLVRAALSQEYAVSLGMIKGTKNRKVKVYHRASL